MSLPPSRRVTLKFGDYRPCLEIGTGGMATVYIARELERSGLQRTVALKVMHEHLARTERYKKRFLDEARILSRLTHPFVCRVFGYGEDDDGRPFMAMEYLVGEPLSRVLRALKHQANGLSCSERARLFGRVIADMAEGIHSAHETRDHDGQLLGVVHRDVSPQNLFMMYDGTVRIVDFGIAWYRDRYVQTATTSRLIGKLPYMAPEQVQGAKYDRRVDVWALGVVLWELVTLERLFRRDTEVQTMEAVCFDTIPLVSEVAPGLPPGFDAILNRALQRDPELRYQTAREFAHDLEVWLTTAGQAVTHADLSRILSSCFPGSEKERMRWAEVAPHSGSRGQIPQVDFATEALAELECDTPAPLSLPPRMIREEDLVSSEYTPPPQFLRRAVADIAQEHRTYEVERGDLISAPPPTNATPMAISVREPRVEQGPSARASSQRWLGVTLGSLTVGFLVGLSVLRLTAGPSAREAASAAQRESSSLIVEPQAVDVPAPLEALSGVNDVANSVVSNDVLVVGPKPIAAADAIVAPEAALETPELSTAPAPISAPVARERTNRELVSPKRTPSDSSIGATTSDQAPGQSSAALGSGDVLVVSATPGANVYLGDKFIGQTPVRTRLPVGPALLSVQLSPQGPRTPITTQVASGRLNIVSLK